MHRLPNRYSVRRFRIASWLLWFRWLVISVGLGYLLISAVTQDYRQALIACAAVSGGLIVCLFQWILSLRARCPLCLAQPLADRRCSKHRTAKRLLGSHRLRVAAMILIRGYFRCPYCGELTAMKSRQDD